MGRKRNLEKIREILQKNGGWMSSRALSLYADMPPAKVAGYLRQLPILQKRVHTPGECGSVLYWKLRKPYQKRSE